METREITNFIIINTNRINIIGSKRKESVILLNDVNKDNSPLNFLHVSNKKPTYGITKMDAFLDFPLS